MRNSNAGFTLAELVVSIALVGVVMSFAIPTFSNLTMDTQKQINLANMSIIKELIQFLIVRKKFWLLPIIALSVILGGLVIFTQGTAISPFIYTIF